MTAVARPIVVGVSGSPASLAAAVSAARQARRGLRPVCLLRAVTGTSRGTSPPRETAGWRRAVDEPDHLRGSLQARTSAIPIRSVVRGGSADLALLDEASRASRVVLGPGRTPDGTLLGPVTTAVVQGAVCLVLVDRPALSGATGVVVGVDGGPGTPALLAAASAEACFRNTSLLVVHAVRRDGATGPGAPPERVAEEAEHQRLQDHVAPLRRTLPGVPVTVQVDHGNLLDVLVTASQDAELLVLGRCDTSRPSRGDKPVAAMERAAGPVLVVPLPVTQQPLDRRLARRTAVALSR